MEFVICLGHLLLGFLQPGPEGVLRTIKTKGCDTMSVDNNCTAYEWQAPVDLDTRHVQAYRKDGVAKIQNLLSAEAIQIVRSEILELVEKLGPSVDKEDRDTQYPSDDIDLYNNAFTQVFNLWTHSELIRSFISGRLASIAAELMGVDGVRVYHDQALFKEPGGTKTPWHMDHYYWPLATEKVLTAWIPLVPITDNMGPLDFALGSQTLDYRRNEELIQLDEKVVASKLAEAGSEVESSPYVLGEISFHQGWVFHRAGANRTHRRREVFTIIYMDQDVTLQKPANPNQKFDRERWCPGVAVGAVIDSDINPIVSGRASNH